MHFYAYDPITSQPVLIETKGPVPVALTAVRGSFIYYQDGDLYITVAKSMKVVSLAGSHILQIHSYAISGLPLNAQVKDIKQIGTYRWAVLYKNAGLSTANVALCNMSSVLTCTTPPSILPDHRFNEIAVKNTWSYLSGLYNCSADLTHIDKKSKDALSTSLQITDKAFCKAGELFPTKYAFTVASLNTHFSKLYTSFYNDLSSVFSVFQLETKSAKNVENYRIPGKVSKIIPLKEDLSLEQAVDVSGNYPVLPGNNMLQIVNHSPYTVRYEMSADSPWKTNEPDFPITENFTLAPGASKAIAYTVENINPAHLDNRLALHIKVLNANFPSNYLEMERSIQTDLSSDLVKLVDWSGSLNKELCRFVQDTQNLSIALCNVSDAPSVHAKLALAKLVSPAMLPKILIKRNNTPSVVIKPEYSQYFQGSGFVTDQNALDHINVDDEPDELIIRPYIPVDNKVDLKQSTETVLTEKEKINLETNLIIFKLIGPPGTRVTFTKRPESTGNFLFPHTGSEAAKDPFSDKDIYVENGIKEAVTGAAGANQTNTLIVSMGSRKGTSYTGPKMDPSKAGVLTESNVQDNKQSSQEEEFKMELKDNNSNKVEVPLQIINQTLLMAQGKFLSTKYGYRGLYATDIYIKPDLTIGKIEQAKAPQITPADVANIFYMPYLKQIVVADKNENRLKYYYGVSNFGKSTTELIVPILKAKLIAVKNTAISKVFLALYRARIVGTNQTKYFLSLYRLSNRRAKIIHTYTPLSTSYITLETNPMNLIVNDRKKSLINVFIAGIMSWTLDDELLSLFPIMENFVTDKKFKFLAPAEKIYIPNDFSMGLFGPDGKTMFVTYSLDPFTMNDLNIYKLEKVNEQLRLDLISELNVMPSYTNIGAQNWTKKADMLELIS